MLSSSPLDFPLAATAALCTLAGMGALRLGWQRREPSRRLSVLAGWLTLGLGLVLWCMATSVEFGISYALASLSLAAWLLVFLPASRGRREPARPVTPTAARDSTSTAHKWLTFLDAGILAGVASCQLTLLLAVWLPTSRGEQMAIASLLFPLLWGLAAFLVCLAGRPLRAGVALVVIAAASTGLLALS